MTARRQRARWGTWAAAPWGGCWACGDTGGDYVVATRGAPGGSKMALCHRCVRAAAGALERHARTPKNSTHRMCEPTLTAADESRMREAQAAGVEYHREKSRRVLLGSVSPPLASKGNHKLGPNSRRRKGRR